MKLPIKESPEVPVPGTLDPARPTPSIKRCKSSSHATNSQEILVQASSSKQPSSNTSNRESLALDSQTDGGNSPKLDTHKTPGFLSKQSISKTSESVVFDSDDEVPTSSSKQSNSKTSESVDLDSDSDGSASPS